MFHHFFFFSFLFSIVRTTENPAILSGPVITSINRVSSLVKYESLPRCVIVEKVLSIASVRVLVQLISITLFDYCRSPIERVSLEVDIYEITMILFIVGFNKKKKKSC